MVSPGLFAVLLVLHATIFRKKMTMMMIMMMTTMMMKKAFLAKRKRMRRIQAGRAT